MNPEIKIIKEDVLGEFRSKFSKVSYAYSMNGSAPENIERGVFHRGNGAAILLYNKVKGTLILTRQFRLPTYLNGNPDGMLLEVCAGTLDVESPEECIRREAEEETGFRVGAIKKVFECFMSPGSVTEMLYLYIAEYDDSMRIDAGGGLAEEHEHIQVVEMPFAQALESMQKGEVKDAKTLILFQYAALNHLL